MCVWCRWMRAPVNCCWSADRPIMRILIIEDEQSLLEGLGRQFEAAGFVVDLAPNGQEGLYFGEEFPIDVAVIDLGLPDISGMKVIERLRAAGRQFPILVLTARGRWQEKVSGLEAGADDYMVKPFQSEELMARVNALLRRSGGWASPTLTCPPVTLDMATQQVQVGNQEVSLTTYEYRALEYLMLHAGKVVSKAELTEHLYADDDDRDSNVIEVFIGRLRRKLDPDNVLRPLETLRGRGYRFRLQRAA